MPSGPSLLAPRAHRDGRAPAPQHAQRRAPRAQGPSNGALCEAMFMRADPQHGDSEPGRVNLWGMGAQAQAQEAEQDATELRAEDFETVHMDSAMETLNPADQRSILTELASLMSPQELQQALEEAGAAPAAAPLPGPEHAAPVRFHGPQPVDTQASVPQGAGFRQELAKNVADSCTLGIDTNPVSGVADGVSNAFGTAYSHFEAQTSEAEAEKMHGKASAVMDGATLPSQIAASVLGAGMSAKNGYDGLRSQAQSQAVRADDRRDGCRALVDGGLQAGLQVAQFAAKNADNVSPVSAGIAMLKSGRDTFQSGQAWHKASALSAEHAPPAHDDAPFDLLEALNNEQVRQVTSYIIHKKGLSAARNGSSTFAAALSLTAGLLTIFATQGAATPLVVGALSATSIGGTGGLGVDKARRKHQRRENTKNLLGDAAPSGFASSDQLGALRDQQLMAELEGEALEPVERELRMAQGNPLREREHMAKAILAMVDQNPAENSAGMKLLDTIGMKGLVSKVLAEDNFEGSLLDNREVMSKVKIALQST